MPGLLKEQQCDRRKENSQWVRKYWGACLLEGLGGDVEDFGFSLLEKRVWSRGMMGSE